MTTLALKNIPDDLYQRLEKVASAKRRSVSEEALQALEKGVEQEEKTTTAGQQGDVKPVLKDLAQFRKGLSLPPGTPSTVEMLREDRSR